MDTCTEICGDKLYWGKVECDDNFALANGDGCDKFCKLEHGYECTKVSNTPSVCTPKCGDGYKITGEACEDGNTNNGDGCSSTCTIEALWTCSGGTNLTADTCKDICGDSKAVG